MLMSKVMPKHPRRVDYRKIRISSYFGKFEAGKLIIETGHK